MSTRLDREATVYRYQMSIGLTRLTTLTLSTDVIDDQFLADDLVVRSYRHLGGFEFSPAAFIRGRVQAGYRGLAAGQGVPPYTGSTLLIAATVPLPGSATMTGTADRDITYALAATPGAERSTFLVNRYRLDLRLALPLKLIVAPYYSTERNRDLGAAKATSPLPRLQRYGTSLFRAFGRTFHIGGAVEIVQTEGSSTRPTRYFLTAEWAP